MQKKFNLDSQDSVLQAADKLVGAAHNILRSAKTEEDLRIGFEKALEPLCENLHIKVSPLYEKSIKSIYRSGRSDACSAHLICPHSALGIG
jgi:hypothetical protein